MYLPLHSNTSISFRQIVWVPQSSLSKTWTLLFSSTMSERLPTYHWCRCLYIPFNMILSHTCNPGASEGVTWICTWWLGHHIKLTPDPSYQLLHWVQSMFWHDLGWDTCYIRYTQVQIMSIATSLSKLNVSYFNAWNILCIKCSKKNMKKIQPKNPVKINKTRMIFIVQQCHRYYVMKRYIMLLSEEETTKI